MTGDVLILEGSPPIEVTLRRSARARRLSLRVSGLDGRVTLTVPRFAPIGAVRRFLDSRRAWIAGAQAGLPDPVAVRPGIDLPLGGTFLRVAEGAGRSAIRVNGQLLVPPSAPGPAARAFLKAEARERLAIASDRHAAALGGTFTSLTLRDTRSRWGSCTSDGRLMFSWRLAMAPDHVLDYVAAHEVAHLRHMDHSAAFWDTVARLYPEHAVARDWLRREGPGLHRYRFED